LPIKPIKEVAGYVDWKVQKKDGFCGEKEGPLNASGGIGFDTQYKIFQQNQSTVGKNERGKVHLGGCSKRSGKKGDEREDKGKEKNAIPFALSEKKKRLGRLFSKRNGKMISLVGRRSATIVPL